MTTISVSPQRHRLGWQAVDITVAGLLTAIAVAEVATPQHPAPVAAVAAGVLAATVGWCRRAPTAAACVGLLSSLVLTVIIGIDLAIAPLVAAIVYFMLGRRSAVRTRVTADALLLTLPVPLVAASPGTSHVVGVATVWLFFFLAPFAAGWWVGRGTLLASELRRNVDELARRQRGRAERAASEERARIARELHDVVAHNVSVMVVQTQAARRVAAGDLAAAGTALQSVSDCGRDALVDMRRMIGVLHRGDLELAAPGLSQLPTLVERAAASGLRVSLEVCGTAHQLPAPIDLASYRLVQEALTNVIKHAGAARAEIKVTYSADAVELDISDPGGGQRPPTASEHAGGHGLIGMRERLALYGGEMYAGERLDGGFQIRAWIPIDEDRQL